MSQFACNAMFDTQLQVIYKIVLYRCQQD